MLLYYGSEKEYKQAKLKAAENFGVRVLPSNLEVAKELDNINEEINGPTGRDILIKMRFEALKIMQFLNAYNPHLIGSVWRGNVRLGSDIDIEVFCDEPEKVIGCLRTRGLEITKTERVNVTEHGIYDSSFHIQIMSYEQYAVEIIVRALDQAFKKRQCDIFGDLIEGLKTKELEKLLLSHPDKKFIPN